MGISVGINGVNLFRECPCWVVVAISDVRSSDKRDGIFFWIVRVIEVVFKDRPILLLGEVLSNLKDRCILRCFV